MKFNRELFEDRYIRYGMYLAILVYFINYFFLNSQYNYYITIFYALFIGLPLVFILFGNFYIYGKRIRSVFLGFTYINLVIGVIPFMYYIWIAGIQYNYLSQLIRTVFLSTLFSVYERIIWWYEQKLPR